MTLESHRNVLRIGITGHRNLTTEQLIALEPVVKRTIENIIAYHQNVTGNISEMVFTSPIAEGADTLFAKTALKYFDCKLKIIFPFEQQEYEKDFSEPAKKDFFELIANEKVSEIKVLNKFDSSERSTLYLENGKKVVDDNDYIIAIWNEKEAKGVGGTAEIVQYAVLKTKNILVINPGEELKIKWNYLPEFYNATEYTFLTKMKGNNLLNDLFTFFDTQASENQQKYKAIWSACFNIGLIAAFLLSIKFAFEINTQIKLVLTVLELLFTLTVIVLIASEKRKSYHKKYLENRFIAERLRINILNFNCGYYPFKSENKAVHKYIEIFENLPPLSFSNKVIQLCSLSNSSLEVKIQIVNSLVIEQLQYHQHREKKINKKSRRNIWATKTLLGIFLLNLILEIIHELIQLAPSIKFTEALNAEISSKAIALSTFLLLFIPALVARLEAVKFINEWERITKQSDSMIFFFSTIKDKINDVKSDKALIDIIGLLNSNMNLENIDWELFMVTKNVIPTG